MTNYLRVTEILYPFSGLKYVDADVLENAAVRGTKVHKICEGIIQGLDWPVPDSLNGYVDSFRQWFASCPPVVAQEQRFFCDKLKITGQVDIITESADGHMIVDLKTSASESKSWWLQGSAYSYLAKLQGYNVTTILFLKLNRDGRYPRAYIYDENMGLFKQVLNVYRYFYARKDQQLETSPQRAQQKIRPSA